MPTRDSTRKNVLKLEQTLLKDQERHFMGYWKFKIYIFKAYLLQNYVKLMIIARIKFTI